MLNWDGFASWFDTWSTAAANGITDYFTNLITAMPLYDVVRFVLALFGVEFSL